MNQTIYLGDELKNGQGLLRLPRMTDAMFVAFCQRNPDLRVERSAQGNLILMAPSDHWTENRGGEIYGDLVFWNRGLKQPGLPAGSSAGYTLPNGAVRSPDVSWMSLDRWDAVPESLKGPFIQGSPEFAIEVMSPSDTLAGTRRKMEEYMANGVLLGWLIDRKRRTVSIYRPNQESIKIVNPGILSADPELPGFTTDLQLVFANDVKRSKA